MRLNTKGPKKGICNICGEEGPLTIDHIPPKGVSRLRHVDMMSLTDLLSIDRPGKSTRYSQSGVYYRTLCAHCNNVKLGSYYDPTLIEVSNSIRAYLESSLCLPLRYSPKVKVNRLMRCVAGHLIAQELNGHRNSVTIDLLTDYFVDQNAAFPPNGAVYYWVYPYSDQVMIRGAGLSLALGSGTFSLFMLMKFFPLTFLILWDQPKEWEFQLRRLDPLLTSDIDQDVAMHIDFHPLPPRRWPEAPAGDGFVMFGPGPIAAVPRQF